jgi:hypothetical protein
MTMSEDGANWIMDEKAGRAFERVGQRYPSFET